MHEQHQRLATIVMSNMGHETYVSLTYGDIAQIPSEIAIISTNSNPERAIGFRGGVARSYTQRWDGFVPSAAELHPLLLIPAFEHNNIQYTGVAGTYRLQRSEETEENITPHKEVLVLRIPRAIHTSTPVQTYQNLVWSLLGSISSLYLDNPALQLRHLALPLLGAGHCQYDALLCINTLLDMLKRWLPSMPMLRKIEFVLYEPSMDADAFLEKMSEGIIPDYIGIFHSYFGQEAISFQTDQTIAALKEKIKTSTEILLLHNPSLCGRLSKACDGSVTFYGEMGVCGRLLAEDFCRHFKSNKEWSLMDQINNLPHTAPWIKSHLHNLRVLGNMSTHISKSSSFEPKLPSDKELLLLLVSIQAVLSHYQERFGE